MIALQLELGGNESDALRRHAESFQPATGDPWEDARLREALRALRDALEAAASPPGDAPGS